MSHRHSTQPEDRLYEKMRDKLLPASAIEVFMHYFHILKSGSSSTISEPDIIPLHSNDIPDLASLKQYAGLGQEILPKTAVLKLNGGLGTTMGLAGPKSLIRVKNGLSFLDVAMRQIKQLSKQYGNNIPLLLMSSFFTYAATRELLEKGTALPTGQMHHFLQHMFPKITASSLEAASYPADPLLEWYPGGHGDLLLSLDTSGTLAHLLDNGYQYLFISNIDNLGATLNLSILGYLSSQNLDVLMEVTNRTVMDRKGGHLARRAGDKRLLLREASQCEDKDTCYFSNTVRHPFFNTNNIWLRLESVQRALNEKKHYELSLVINRKHLDPTDPATPEIVQLESTLGSAISIFDKSGAIRVPRSRFAPVKNCEELLLLRSDYYLLNEDYSICVNPDRILKKIRLSLDPRFYSRADLLEERFPYGAPSLIGAESLTVHGDVRFGREVRVRGMARITNNSAKQAVIGHGTLISGDVDL